MERVTYQEGLFEHLELEEEYEIEGKKKKITRNIVRRPPGIRALIVNEKEGKILLSKEYRYELSAWDYRLPGGKVFDSSAEYKEALKKGNIDDYALQAAHKEVMEEIGFTINNPKLIKISKDGASVIWDLYYYEITDYSQNEEGPMLEENEIISGYTWVSFDDIIDLCISNQIHEERTIGVLLTYILKKKGE
ncbi:MAG: NUDIX hydrolase [Bacilli bacterium]|nr:NUDIX hydrolase [Bacilli bacterium]